MPQNNKPVSYTHLDVYKRQLVHRAKITTVHALCLSLAREQAAVLGIAPDFRLMDENEGKLLRAEVLEEVLDTAYELSLIHI